MMPFRYPPAESRKDDGYPDRFLDHPAYITVEALAEGQRTSDPTVPEHLLPPQIPAYRSVEEPKISVVPPDRPVTRPEHPVTRGEDRIVTKEDRVITNPDRVVVEKI